MATFTRVVTRFMAPAFVVAVLFVLGCKTAPLTIGLGPNAPVSQEAINDIVELLELNESQRSAANALYAVYLRQFQAASEKVQKWTQELANRPTSGTPEEKKSMAQGTAEGMEKFEQHCDKLMTELFDDIKLVLNEQQLEQWGRAEMAVLRRRMLATPDLAHIVEQAAKGSSQRPDVAAAIEQWHQQLDPVFKKKLAYVRSTRRANMVAQSIEDKTTTTRILQGWEDLVRDERVVAMRARGEIESALTQDEARVFHRLVTSELHGGVFNDLRSTSIHSCDGSQAEPANEAIKKMESANLTRAELDAARATLVKASKDKSELALRIAAEIEAWEIKAPAEELIEREEEKAILARGLEARTVIDRRTERELTAALSTESLRALGIKAAPAKIPDLEF